MPGIKQLSFLNPASTLTPGIAGGFTTTIALAIATQFDLKLNWVALSVSLLLGAVVALSYPQKIAPILRSLYIVLNALVIFSFSVGAGRILDPPPSPPVTTSTETAPSISKVTKGLRAVTKQPSQPEYQQKRNQYDEARARYDERWSW